MTHLERAETGAAWIHGWLFTATGQRVPIILSHEDWEALEAALAGPERVTELREAAMRRVVNSHNDYVTTLLRERDSAEAERAPRGVEATPAAAGGTR